MESNHVGSQWTTKHSPGRFGHNSDTVPATPQIVTPSRQTVDEVGVSISVDNVHMGPSTLSSLLHGDKLLAVSPRWVGDSLTLKIPFYKQRDTT